MTEATRRLIGWPMLLAMAGCAALPPTPETDRVETPAQATERRSQAPRPTYNLTGYPPAVREGYIDGCETAKGSAYARKDSRRIAKDAQYAMGWNDGLSICQKR